MFLRSKEKTRAIYVNSFALRFGKQSQNRPPAVYIYSRFEVFSNLKMRESQANLIFFLFLPYRILVMVCS